MFQKNAPGPGDRFVLDNYVAVMVYNRRRVRKEKFLRKMEH